MKITIFRRMEIDLDDTEFNLIIHALQSHARVGDNEWPGEATEAAQMRDELMNAELRDRGQY